LPHVHAGVVALHLASLATAPADGNDVMTKVVSAIITKATTNKVISPGSKSPNRLLYWGL
jgi:hypothetical protein